MPKRDKSVIRRSVKREMTIIKNLYMTSSANISTIINTNNEDQVNYSKIIIQTIKSNCT